MHTITLEPGKQFHTHRGILDHDTLLGGPEGVVVTVGTTPYLALRPAAAGLRAVDAARRAGRLPQGRRPDRADGRRLPRRARRRGRRRQRRAVDVAAARGGGVGAAVVVRAAGRLRRDRAAQRRALLRRRPPGLVGHRRRPAGRLHATPTSTAWCSTCSRPGRPSTSSRGRCGPAAWCAATSPRRRSCPPRWRRCARTARSPSRSRGSRSCAAGTSRAWRCARSTG